MESELDMVVTIKNAKNEKQSHEIEVFDVGDTIRTPAYQTSGGYRVWMVTAVCLGGTYQESTYNLKPVDLHGNEEIHVPCIMLETHPNIQKV